MSSVQQRSRAVTWIAVAGLAVAIFAGACVAAPTPKGSAEASTAIATGPPPSSGYFALRPAGAWASLPTGSTCAVRVHRSSWEPRPDNRVPNHTMPVVRAVHRAFTARPLSGDGSYSPRWDTWLLPRVSGQFTGTTDEIFQWAACKWGLPDNLLRAMAVRESTWYQGEVYPSGRPVTNWGMGDLFTRSSAASRTYCDGLARYGRDYQQDFAAGKCPKTFSILGVMSWQAPSWGRMPANQNGTFPFNRNSTAFAADYLGSQLRGCFEGWQRWLDNTGSGGYSAGQLWGCVGAWYSGAWRDTAANGYISRVQDEQARRLWLRPNWRDIRPACSATWGCPQGPS